MEGTIHLFLSHLTEISTKKYASHDCVSISYVNQVSENVQSIDRLERCRQDAVLVGVVSKTA